MMLIIKTVPVSSLDDSAKAATAEPDALQKLALIALVAHKRDVLRCTSKGER